MRTPPDPPELSVDTEDLEQELRDWWDRQNEEWGSGAEGESMEGGELWDHMPEIDSKAVMRTAPIFEDHLDTDFDPSMVREGGYSSINDLINDLVPRIAEKVADKGT